MCITDTEYSNVLPRIDEYPESISEDAEEATPMAFYASSPYFVFSFEAYYFALFCPVARTSASLSLGMSLSCQWSCPY